MNRGPAEMTTYNSAPCNARRITGRLKAFSPADGCACLQARVLEGSMTTIKAVRLASVVRQAMSWSPAAFRSWGSTVAIPGPCGSVPTQASLILAMYAAARTIPLALFAFWAIYEQAAPALVLTGCACWRHATARCRNRSVLSCSSTPAVFKLSLTPLVVNRSQRSFGSDLATHKAGGLGKKRDSYLVTRRFRANGGSNP